MHPKLRMSQPTWFAEWPLFMGAISACLVLAHIDPAGPLWTGWLLFSIVACAARAMAHADLLAERFGEPAGTIILTVAAIIIEVAAVCAIMLGSSGNPAVARDSMFAVIMLIMNGLVGGCILIGTWRRNEVTFNADSALSYLPMLITLATITLVLPRFSSSEEGGWMSNGMEVFVGGGSLVLYGSFLWLQSSRYKGYFAVGHPEAAVPAEHVGHISVPKAVTLLLISLLIVVICAEGMAGRVGRLLNTLHLPPEFGGVFIAVMVLTPEGFAALLASARGDMQRSINVLLGSAVATIGLTVPAVLTVRWITGVDPEFGLEAPYIVLLALTFFVSALNLMRGRVNAMQGLMHLLILFGWLVTILDESVSPDLP